MEMLLCTIDIKLCYKTIWCEFKKKKTILCGLYMQKFNEINNTFGITVDPHVIPSFYLYRGY